jgi:flagellar hook protein FlgE
MQKEVSGGATPVTRWRYDITIPNNEIAGVPSTDTQEFSLITGAVTSGAPSAGALVFDSAGTLTSAYIGPDPSTPPPLADITFPPSSVTLPPLTNGGVFKTTGLTWKLLDAQGTPEITGFGSASTVTASGQDGTGAGTLTNFAIGPDGTITAVFSNGQVTPVAQIVLAEFANEDGLVPQGGGFYAESIASGASFIGAPGDGGRGQLLSAALESSNVDLAAELTKIITYQRGYQANARVISVTDQIMQETMNIKQ